MRILYYGPTNGNSGSRFNGLKLLGHEVEHVFQEDPLLKTWKPIRWLENRIYNGPVTMRLNKLFFQKAINYKPDLVWIEMGRSIYAKTLKQIKEQLGCLMVNSYSDDFINKHSRHYNSSIPLYDYIFTPRRANFEEYYKFGAKAVDFFWKGYAPENHFPVELTEEERNIYGSDVVFVGHCEKNRMQDLSQLAGCVKDMKIWGPWWNHYRIPKVLRAAIQNRSVWWEEYRKALCGSKITINYFSRWARDTQSSRSFEIPACGVFMLCERTDDILNSFEEDKEAVFFSSPEELIDKTKFYLRNDRLRQQIAFAGHQRCITSGYSNHDRIKVMLEKVINTTKAF
jgi:spore maturation protein CgeB